jgi:formate dehydrogenase alpha subunit
VSYVITTCPFCGCGCGLYLEVQDRKVIGAAPSVEHPVSQGRLCVKGWHAHELATSPQRFRTPLVRRNGRLREASWEEALDRVASRLNEIKATGGPGVVGVLGSARGTNEENYLLAKLARCSLGTNNVDFTDRLEALPGVFDLPRYRHLTAPACELNDLDRADLIILWQSDPSQEHPAVASRLLRAVERGAPLVEIAARRSGLSSLASHHLSPRPGTDVYLIYGLLRAALERKRPSTPAAEALATSISDWVQERTETVTAVPADLVNKVAEMISRAHRPLIVCTRGTSIQQHAAELLNSLSALPYLSNGGASPSPVLLWLSHYSNLQGARDMGVVPYFVTGHQGIADEQTRAKFGRRWGSELPTEPGFSVWDMLGQVRGLLVMGDDPVGRLPDAGGARAALEGMEFVAVIEIFPTATTEVAEVVLPGTSFAEKDGTFTSADRRVQRVRQAGSPPGAAKPEWRILCELSSHFGYAMSYDSPSKVMDEIAALTPAYEGVSFAALEAAWGLRLPVPDHVPPPELNGADEETQSILHKAVPGVDAEFPLVMTVDYSLQTWVDDPMVAGTVTLRRELGADQPRALPTIEISSGDANELQVRDGQRVRVRSRTGEAEAVAHVTADVAPGTVVLPFAVRELVAQVMPPALHPESGVPMLPPCAVSVRRA